MPDPGERTATLHSSPRAREPVELEVGSRLGRFVIERTIGAGGMGTVFAARDPDLDRPVAIKMLHAGTADRARQQRLLAEARAIAKIRHPNVVVVHEIGEHEQRLFVVMELVEGVSLREWLDKPHSSDEKIAVLVAAARGLAHAHAQGITHRDFKPENLMIGSDGHAKVVDFGIAQLESSLRDKDLDVVSVTQSADVIGTPPYMAPEQLRGESATPAADQYSWCLTLYEALVGDRPNRDLAAIAAGAEITIEVPTSLPARVRTVLARGLARKARYRYASMDELIAHIASAPRRRWPLAVAGGLAIGAAVTAGAFMMRGHDDHRAQPVVAVDPCAAGVTRMDAAWNRTLKGPLATSVGTVAPQVTEALDTRANAWRTSYVAVCNAQGPARAHRMSCLDDSLASVSAFVDFWTARPADVDPTSAVDGARAIRDPRACETAVPVDGEVPRTPAEDALFARLEKANVARTAAAYQQSVEIAHGVADDAKKLPSDRVFAKARIISGDGLGFLQKMEQSESDLRDAVDAASRSKEDSLAASAWGALITTVGVHEGKADDALKLAVGARAAVARLGGKDHEADLRLHLDLGRVMNVGEHFADAKTELEQAVAVLEQPPRLSDKLVGEVHFELATALTGLGDKDGAATQLQTALAAQRRAYGDNHPAVGQTLQYLGLDRMERADNAGAETYMQQARVAFEGSVGHDHPLYASVLCDLGTVQTRQGKLDAARPNIEQCRDGLIAAYGIEDGNATSAYEVIYELATAYAKAHQTTAARDLLKSSRTAAAGNAKLVGAIDKKLAALK
ncbi:MAG TPA: serine/threonine-protein kinase [Kofleriaceae bacterium]|jgi:predicted Ser/Thr protein kinase